MQRSWCTCRLSDSSIVSVQPLYCFATVFKQFSLPILKNWPFEDSFSVMSSNEICGGSSCSSLEGLSSFSVSHDHTFSFSRNYGSGNFTITHAHDSHAKMAIVFRLHLESRSEEEKHASLRHSMPLW